MPRQTDHSDREILRSWSVSQSRGKFLVQRLGLTTLRTSRRRTLNSRRISWPSLFLSSWSNFHSITRRSAVSVTPSVCAVVPGIGNKTRTVEMSLIPTVAGKNRKRPGQDRTINLLGIGVVGKRLNSVVKSRIRWPLKAALSPGVQPNGTFSYYYLLSILAFLVWEGFTFTGFLALWWPATGAGFAYKSIWWVSRTDSSNKEEEMGFTLTFAVGFVVSDGRSRNGFAIGRDAPTIARPLMALFVYDKSQVIFAFLFLFSQAFYFDSISGLTYLNFRESSVLVAFRNESLASRRRFFAQSTSTADAARLVSLVQSPGCSLSQPSLRHTTFLGSCKNNQPPQVKRKERKRMSRWICCCC